jgi:hypothetical protein
MIFGPPSFPTGSFRTSPSVSFVLPRSNTRSRVRQNGGCYSFEHKIVHRVPSSAPMPLQTPLVFNNIHGRCRRRSAATPVFSIVCFTTPITHTGTPSKSETVAKMIRHFEPLQDSEGTLPGTRHFEPSETSAPLRAFGAMKSLLGPLRSSSATSRNGSRATQRTPLLRCRSLASLLR